MIEIGRMCVKIAGRDAGQKCVITSIVDDTYVMIDGQTRARKCNIRHLEPMAVIIELPKNAGHEAVLKALKEQGVEVAEEKKEKKAAAKTEKPKKVTKTRNKPAEEPKKATKAAKPAKKAKK